MREGIRARAQGGGDQLLTAASRVRRPPLQWSFHLARDRQRRSAAGPCHHASPPMGLCSRRRPCQRRAALARDGVRAPRPSTAPRRPLLRWPSCFALDLAATCAPCNPVIPRRSSDGCCAFGGRKSFNVEETEGTTDRGGEDGVTDLTDEMLY